MKLLMILGWTNLYALLWSGLFFPIVVENKAAYFGVLIVFIILAVIFSQERN